MGMTYSTAILNPRWLSADAVGSAGLGMLIPTRKRRAEVFNSPTKVILCLSNGSIYAIADALSIRSMTVKVARKVVNQLWMT